MTTEDLTPALARHLGYPVSRGAMVGEVRGGSPADDAGLEGGNDEQRFNGLDVTTGGDVIVAVDGHPVRRADQVVRDIGSRLPGETVRLTVVRGQERKTLTARLEARPDADTNP